MLCHIISYHIILFHFISFHIYIYYIPCHMLYTHTISKTHIYIYICTYICTHEKAGDSSLASHGLKLVWSAKWSTSLAAQLAVFAVGFLLSSYGWVCLRIGDTMWHPQIVEDKLRIALCSDTPIFKWREGHALTHSNSCRARQQQTVASNSGSPGTNFHCDMISFGSMFHFGLEPKRCQVAEVNGDV